MLGESVKFLRASRRSKQRIFKPKWRSWQAGLPARTYIKFISCPVAIYANCANYGPDTNVPQVFLASQFEAKIAKSSKSTIPSISKSPGIGLSLYAGSLVDNSKDKSQVSAGVG